MATPINTPQRRAPKSISSMSVSSPRKNLRVENDESRDRVIAGTGVGVGTSILALVILFFFMWYFSSSGGGGRGGGAGSGEGGSDSISSDGHGQGGMTVGSGQTEGQGAGANSDVDPSESSSTPATNATTSPVTPPSATPSGPPNMEDKLPEAPKQTTYTFGGSLAKEANSNTNPDESGGQGVGGLQEITRRVEGAGGKSGDVQASLIWNNKNDLDLFIVCPSSERIFFDNKKSKCNGELDVDMNADGPDSDKPVENIYWAAGKAPRGRYVVYIDYYQQHIAQDRTRYEVAVTVDGKVHTFKGTITKDKRNVKIFEFKR